MILDRLFADEKFLADLFVAVTLSHKLHDLFFTVAEQGFVAPDAALGTLGEGAHNLSRHAIVEPDFAAKHAVDALDEQVAGRLFQYDAASAQAHGTHDVTIVFGGGQHDDAGGQ